jgi:hypothetical protein
MVSASLQRPYCVIALLKLCRDNEWFPEPWVVGLTITSISWPQKTQKTTKNSLFTAQLSFALQGKHGSASGGRSCAEPLLRVVHDL